MTPTEELKKEHEAIRTMLGILERVCTKLESGAQANLHEVVDPVHLEQIVEFIRVFADKCHHGKEEDLLFPAMEAAGFPRHGGPTGVMLKEHDEGRGYVRALSEAVSQFKAGDLAASVRIIQSARNYIALLDQHIEKENNVLFPMADMHLSEEKQRELSAGFERIETERVGAVKHEEFHQLLHNLKGIYFQ